MFPHLLIKTKIVYAGLGMKSIQRINLSDGHNFFVEQTDQVESILLCAPEMSIQVLYRLLVHFCYYADDN